MAGAFLLDRNSRRQPFDRIDIRLSHLFEKLAGIGGERFDVSALSFRIDRIERQRRFSGAAQAGDDHEFVPRNLHVQILKIVLARATNDD